MFTVKSRALEQVTPGSLVVVNTDDGARLAFRSTVVDGDSVMLAVLESIDDSKHVAGWVSSSLDFTVADFGCDYIIEPDVFSVEVDRPAQDLARALLVLTIEKEGFGLPLFLAGIHRSILELSSGALRVPQDAKVCWFEKWRLGVPTYSQNVQWLFDSTKGYRAQPAW